MIELPLAKQPGTGGEKMHVDEKDGTRILVCTVGSTVLHYDARCIDDLHAMLKQAGDWVELGGADEQKPAKEGTVEAWGRSPQNPIGGWYGLKKGLRGRFGMYMPPLLEARRKAGLMPPGAGEAVKGEAAGAGKGEATQGSAPKAAPAAARATPDLATIIRQELTAAMKR